MSEAMASAAHTRAHRARAARLAAALVELAIERHGRGRPLSPAFGASALEDLHALLGFGPDEPVSLVERAVRVGLRRDAGRLGLSFDDDTQALRFGDGGPLALAFAPAGPPGSRSGDAPCAAADPRSRPGLRLLSGLDETAPDPFLAGAQGLRFAPLPAALRPLARTPGTGPRVLVGLAGVAEWLHGTGARDGERSPAAAWVSRVGIAGRRGFGPAPFRFAIADGVLVTLERLLFGPGRSLDDRSRDLAALREAAWLPHSEARAASARRVWAKEDVAEPGPPRPLPPRPALAQRRAVPVSRPAPPGPAGAMAPVLRERAPLDPGQSDLFAP